MKIKTVIKARVLAMNVQETIPNRHLTIEEGDAWVKKNLNETGQVMEVELYEKETLLKTIKNATYLDPTTMSFTMNVEQYYKKRDENGEGN